MLVVAVRNRLARPYNPCHLPLGFSDAKLLVEDVCKSLIYRDR